MDIALYFDERERETANRISEHLERHGHIVRRVLDNLPESLQPGEDELRRLAFDVDAVIVVLGAGSEDSEALGRLVQLAAEERKLMLAVEPEVNWRRLLRLWIADDSVVEAGNPDALLAQLEAQPKKETLTLKKAVDDVLSEFPDQAATWSAEGERGAFWAARQRLQGIIEPYRRQPSYRLAWAFAALWLVALAAGLARSEVSFDVMASVVLVIALLNMLRVPAGAAR
jgi:hypothetical protein